MTSDTRIKTAWHEAGHCVVTAAFGRRIDSVTILPDGDLLGVMLYHPPLEPVKRVAILAAGFAAEQLLGAEVSARDDGDERSDLTKIVEISAALNPGGDPCDAPAFREGVELAMKILHTRRGAVRAIARRLLRVETIDGAEVRAIVRRHRRKATAA